MKYIRTKDGVYDLSTLYIQNCNLLKTGCKKLYDKLMSEKIKEANTIEELCDEFVSVRDNYHDHWDNFEEPRTLCSESDVYGAIWTDKGLTYVAKMNEKGELELL